MKLDNVKFEKALANRKVGLKELCMYAGISVSALVKMRRGNTPRPATVGRIAEALGVSVSDIIKDEEG